MNGYPGNGAGSVNSILSATYDRQANTTSQTRTAPVHEAQESLSKAITILHGQLDSLEARLGPILAQVPAGNSPSPGPDPIPSVATRINLSAQSVAGAAARVADLLNRLEV